MYDIGNGNPPYGFVIQQVDASYNPVEIKGRNGTKGVFVERGVLKYHNRQSGGFYGECFIHRWKGMRSGRADDISLQ